MVPLQVILLIMTVVLYAAEDHGRGHLPASPAVIIATVVASHACLVIVAGQFARRAARMLHRSDVDPSRMQSRVDRALSTLRLATIALAVGQLWFGGWGTLVLADPASVPGAWGLGRYRAALLPHALFFAAPLVSWMCFWAGEYRVESAIKARTLPYRLARGLPTHEPPTLGQYLMMKARHNFYFFVPMGLATAAEGVADNFRRPYPWLPMTTSLVMLAVLLSFLPWMLTRIWSTVAMTGPLRARLDAVAARYHVRFSSIRIWRTHHAVSNAAILGYLPFSRYFLMTDALLESLTDQQIEAVFAHEVGHGYHKHIWWYLLAVGGALLGAVGLSTLAGTYVPELPAWIQAYREDALGLLQLALIAAFMAWGFSPISRRFEHQADWFAAQHMATTVTPPPTQVPVPPQVTPAAWLLDSTGALTPAAPAQPPAAHAPIETPRWLALATGAEVFSSALLHLVSLSHRSPTRGGWMHPSPVKRAALLHELALDPALVERFGTRMRWTRAYIAAVFVVGAGLCVASIVFDRPARARAEAAVGVSEPP